jgi:hypothetical protein
VNENSRAYKDAWKRVRDAIDAELAIREIVISAAALDDMAAMAVRAAFGLDDDSE